MAIIKDGINESKNIISIEQKIAMHKKNIHKIMLYLFQDNKDNVDELSQSIQYILSLNYNRYSSFFCQELYSMFGNSDKKMLALGSIFELINAYMFIYDDLPIFDNDDFRRGQLSCHKKFNPTIATLTANLLLQKAQEIIFSDNILKFDLTIKYKLLKIINTLYGTNGIILCQQKNFILQNNNNECNDNELLRFVTIKSSVLLTSIIDCVGVIFNIKNNDINLLKTFARNLGLMIKIQNDLTFNNMNFLNKKIVSKVALEMLFSQSTDNVKSMSNSIQIINFMNYIYNKIDKDKI